MQTYYLDQIRSFEGYTPKAQWDYAQFTNGYGTKARFAGEVISKTEAEQRFKAEIAEARSVVEKVAPNVDEGTKAALTSLTYNAGSAWVKSGLGEAVRAGDLDKARQIFVQYNKAGGDVVAGLVNRRLEEVTWIGNPDVAQGGGGGGVGRSTPAVAIASETGLPRLPISGATARVSMPQYALLAAPQGQGRDVLSDLLASASRGSVSKDVGGTELKPQEAKIVTSASDLIASAIVSDLALMAETGAVGAGSVLSYTRGDVERGDDREQSNSAASVTTTT